MRVRELTLESLGDSPEIGAAVDIPLDVASGRGGKGVVAVGGIGFRVEVITVLAQLRVRVLLVAKDGVDASLDLFEYGLHGDYCRRRLDGGEREKAWERRREVEEQCRSITVIVAATVAVAPLQHASMPACQHHRVPRPEPYLPWGR